jgi:hypothetical protein
MCPARTHLRHGIQHYLVVSRRQCQFAVLFLGLKVAVACQGISSVYVAREHVTMISSRSDHHSFAETLRRRVLEGPGQSDPALRQRVAARSAGGPSIEAPYDDLARQIGEAACRTTDTQVANVLAVAGSEKAAFELIAAAATGAGLLRWQQAIKALEETSDAPA